MLTEKEVLERAFRALDELVGRQVKIEARPNQDESNTSRRCISEEPAIPAEIPPATDCPEMPDPTPQAGAVVGRTLDTPTASLKGQAVELWRDGNHFFVVVDEEDSQEAIRRFGATRGEIWTPGEIELVARIENQNVRNEVAEFKRELDGSLSRDVAAEGAAWATKKLARTGKPGATVRR